MSKNIRAIVQLVMSPNHSNLMSPVLFTQPKFKKIPGGSQKISPANPIKMKKVKGERCEDQDFLMFDIWWWDLFHVFFFIGVCGVVNRVRVDSCGEGLS
jgi:hypothetical protein